MCTFPKSPLKALSAISPVALLKNPKKALNPRNLVKGLAPSRGGPSSALKAGLSGIGSIT